MTLRVRREVGFLRKQRILREVVKRLARASDHFRVVHFSVQHDHLHLIVEAENGRWLARKMTGLTTWLARRVNGILARSGAFFADRYHRRDLRTPSEVRNALLYVLKNRHKHHFEQTGRVYPGLDEYSSSAWFDGWAPGAEADVARARREQARMLGRMAEAPPLERPTTWLAKHGWQRAQGGLLDIREMPRAAASLPS